MLLSVYCHKFSDKIVIASKAKQSLFSMEIAAHLAGARNDSKTST